VIVVDTNIISYLLLPTPMTDAAEALYLADPQWAAPVLWRSEFRNVLALYLRKGLLVLDEALSVQERAEDLLAGREYQVRSADVLRLAHASGCSAYDCEFVAVACDLGMRLCTADKRLLNAFPDIAVALRAEDK
jgi:predicted nucleic acid-binding protein